MRTANRRNEPAPAAGGMVAHLIDRAFENPATSGGLMVMALTAAAIFSNATLLQNGRHPDPLFASRPAPALSRVTQPVAGPVPRVRAEQQVVVVPPLPHLAPSAAPPSAMLPVADTALVTEIQRELARLGLYTDAIDGVVGSRTVAAITAYETAAGRPATGLPTATLLEAMRLPLPSRETRAVVDGADQRAAIATELDRRERERAENIANEQRAQAERQLQANYRIIQGSLNRIGYGPVPVDGAASAETADAIRRFELDNGLPITGAASDRLIGHLISIGAVNAT